MYIEEITLDGFKSYATRVTVPNFDPFFNAITGLNGSGKSNILDAICFVLGITNLSQVRANSLQELVYKQGQAGVTKATVSIVFNNTDKANGPVEYQHLDQITVTRQLVIGGRNKYLINGHVAQPTRVQNLFHSVSLNVNNPHFLIMQGRITKVLNMKPPEILGMLEEAAGTRMYETKKDAALRTLEKKQVKVTEIEKVMNEEILPACERLRREKGQYMEWQAANANADRLRRFCVAYRYVQAQRMEESGKEEIEREREGVAELARLIAELDAEAAEKERDIAQLQAQKERQSGREVKELAEEADGLSKNELAEETLAAKVAVAAEARDAAAAAADAAAGAVEAAVRELAGAEAGDGRDESNRSVQERLADAQTAQTAAEGEVQEANVRAKHLEKQLSEQRKALAAKEKEAGLLAQELKRERGTLAYDEAAAAQLQAAADTARVQVQRCKDHVDQLSSTLTSMDFQYKDPDRGFNRAAVKGVVAKLVRVKDPSTTTALEVAAGGKLYQVVVDSEATAKALLSRGQLRNRVTIIPLNKSRAHAVQAAAAKIGRGRATIALELVGFDADLGAAMKYAFGNAFVCKDATTAKSLAFHKEVRTRCVTLEGDDFNPSGTLTGGSRSAGASLLTRLHELALAEEELAGHSETLAAAEAQLKGMAAAAKEHAKLMQELELKAHALSLLQERIAGSESAQLAEAVAALEADLAAAKDAAAAAKARKAQMAASAKELEKELGNLGKEKDKHIKAAQAKLKGAKSGAETVRGKLKKAAAALAEAAAEKEAAAEERAALETQLAAAEATVKELEAAAEKLDAEVAEVRGSYEAAAAKLQERRDALSECERGIGDLAKQRAQLERESTDAAVNKKKLEHKLARMEKDARDSADVCKQLEKEYPWIGSEKRLFGRPGSDYDWTARDPEAAFAEYKKLEDTLQGLSKTLNKRVMQMFDKAEAEYRELSEKKRIVENDKEKIKKVIAELDEKKREALGKTWRKVNQDFGSIFSVLLPGTSAKLEPPEGATFLDGLEVRVAFGDVWKESLTELSGGQRSLLALSLILAMLLFKPAPIYILDEVDAALDLSHTQNIGRMIKSHFPYSQFIVVSLKEGMFSNANVLFRTKFVDGVSAVTRTATHQKEGTAAQQQKASQRQKRPALTENVRV
ncbi:RecF/RecN/SMC protein [Coccomyxa subellipsoidea C-169]|uniref:RecF/RecN/SMC protein n=1 Tax=Coccomyxa subellipsoidea (strain C-169) TaxID=574566 RepID=I0YIK0_COCSC|nr:RecF/RecN/SMC protein [Coccomyxa subellipsoidea C-169]EIE18219.1 RecF/RecN/SMC protein [Coccomyxa subellipsoidea C-169]|eukprot:XP_005642763.1 RecF/RecN/SMC protein [Coccomyxa subellipsoidea C-169]